MEIHQQVKSGENCATIPDLRELGHEKYALLIEPYEGVTPGFILYIPIDEEFDDASLEIEYKYHRLIKSEPLFIESIVFLGIWLIAVFTYTVSYLQVKKYKERHERDNEIIQESIETFTGFIGDEGK